MVLDWFSGGKVDLPDLLAKKKYTKAIEVMRAQFKESPPTVETRLLFVDCLILAGRGKEAVPVLIGLADEVLGEGQAAKALGLLKRAQQIEPDRPEVEAKLAGLVKKEFEDAAQAEPMAVEVEPAAEPESPPAEPPAAPPAKPAPPAKRPAAKVTVSNRVAFDLEEIPEAEQSAEAKAAAAEPNVTLRIRGAFRRFLSTLPGSESAPETAAAAAEAETAAPAAAEDSPVELEFDPPEGAPLTADEQPLEIQPDEPASGDGIEIQPEPEAAAEPEPEAEPQVEPEPEIATEAEPPTEPDVEPEIEAPVEVSADQPVETAPDSEPEVAVASAETEVEAEVEADAEPAVAVDPEPEPEPQVEIEAQPPVAARDEVELSPDAALALAALDPQPDVVPAATEPAEEPMSEETFQGQVLDLMQEVVEHPQPAAAPAGEETVSDEKPVRTRGVTESAQQLLASPLFRDMKEAELLAVVRGMRLHTYEAGDVVLTEGEPGDSLFIVTSGSVRVFVRNPAGHNFEMGVLKEGEFFGEISSLSGRPRTGTVVATQHTELLELDKPTVDQIARTHPRVRETLENYYIQRASSPEAAAIRAVPVDPGSRQRAIDVLEAYFGESRWDPRMRLRLADLLVKAGKEEDAVPLLVGLADDLDRAGFPEKAIAILKKIEKIRKRGTREVNLAPLAKKKKTEAKPASKPAPAAAPGQGRAATAEHFSNWIVDVVRDAVVPKPTPDATSEPKPPSYAHGLLATPLFEGLSEDELLTMIRELRLMSFDPGDIILTEGEQGQSLFILTAGAVKIQMKNARGKNVLVAELRAGSFFGEMASVSGKPRTATVTAAHPVELLELDKKALDAIASRHPRVRAVLEDVYMTRAESPQASRARSSSPKS